MSRRTREKTKLATKIVAIVLTGALVFMMPAAGLAQDPVDPSEELVYDMPVENVVETPADEVAPAEEPAPAPDPVVVPDPAPAADNTASDTQAAAPAAAVDDTPAEAADEPAAAPASPAANSQKSPEAPEDEADFQLMADYTLEYGESITLTAGFTGGTWSISPSGYANLNGRTVTNRNARDHAQDVTVTHLRLFPLRSETFTITCMPQKFDVRFFLQDAGQSSAAQIGDTQQVYRGSSATVPSLEPQKTIDGKVYKLYKWYTDDTWSTTTDAGSTINRATDFYAKYATESTIHYVKNTSEVATVPDDQTDGAGNKVTIGTATTAGKTLSSWNTAADGSGDPYAPGEVIAMPDTDLTLYAQWSDDLMSITYIYNYAGSYNEIFYYDNTVPKHSRTNLYAETPDGPPGYIFLGWSRFRTGDPEFLPGATYETGNSSNVDLYALWGSISGDILYIDELTAFGTEVFYTGLEQVISGVDEGESSAHPGFVRVGETFALIPLVLYADISDIVAAGTNAGSYSTPLAAQLYQEDLVGILWPVWTLLGGNEFIDVVNNILVIKPIELTITTDTDRQLCTGSTLDAGGKVTFTDAEGIPHEETFEPGSGTVTLVNGETLSIHTTGSQNGVGTSDNTYALDWGAGSTAQSFNYKIVAESLGNLTLYYRIDFDANLDDEVSGMPESMEVEDMSTTLPSDEPTTEKCTFAGWATEEGATEAEYQPGAELAGLDDLQKDGVITLYAVWTPKTFTVTYTDGAGGTVFADKVYEGLEYDADTPIYVPTEMKPDCTFEGWNPDLSATVTEDATYTAIWKEIAPEPNVGPDDESYTISFDPNGGVFRGSTDPVTFDYADGEVITIPEAPEREGYTFLYWKGSKLMPGDSYTVSGDHEFVAQWAKGTAVKSDKNLAKTADGNMVAIVLTIVLVGGAAMTFAASRRRRSDRD